MRTAIRFPNSFALAGIIIMLASFRAPAYLQDSTFVAPVGQWNMNTTEYKYVDLPNPGFKVSDILSYQVVIYSDVLADGTIKVRRLDTQGTSSATNHPQEVRGGVSNIEMSGTSVRIRMVAGTGRPTGAGPGCEFNRSDYRWLNYGGTTNNPAYNRGFIRINYRGLSGSKPGYSTLAVSQPYAIRSIAIPLGARNLNTYPHIIPIAPYGVDYDRVVSFDGLVANDYDGKTSPDTVLPVRNVGYAFPISPEYPAQNKMAGNGSSINSDGFLINPNYNGSGIFSLRSARFASSAHNRGFLKMDYIAARCGENDLNSGGFFYYSNQGTSNPNDCGGAHNNVTFIQTSGFDIWGTSDQAGLFSSDASGTNKTIYTRIESIERTADMAKTGVVLRKNGGANAAYVGVLVTPTRGVMLHWRLTDGGSTFRTHSSTEGGYNANSVKPPVWVKVVKTGNTFLGSYSTNSTTGTDGTWTKFVNESNGAANFTVTPATFVGTYQAGILASSQATGIQNTMTATRLTLATP